MDRETFIGKVDEAVEGLPQEFKDYLENVAIVVEDSPSQEQLRKAKVDRRHTLLGLYEGVPMTSWGRNYQNMTPEKITIFQRTIESKAFNELSIIDEIRRVVRHEIAHHFGIDDDRLDEIEKRND
jgi:predicted Zn-dependent protease with MMP-like domain